MPTKSMHAYEKCERVTFIWRAKEKKPSVLFTGSSSTEPANRKMKYKTIRVDARDKCGGFVFKDWNASELGAKPLKCPNHDFYAILLTLKNMLILAAIKKSLSI